ncbi:MAG: type II toxin-antitoxin system VapC family toxin [Iamia sp.]
MMAPHLIDVEVTSAWRRLVAAGDVDERRVDLARADLRDLRLHRVPHGLLLDRAWALRTNITAYDAVYVALAELTDSVLLTADGRVAAAPGPRCEIELLT